jgi:hypothetical protein
MAHHLRVVRNDEPEPHDSDRISAFLAGLTALSEIHDIAIADGSELYEMEPDDRLASYHADDGSRLSRR